MKRILTWLASFFTKKSISTDSYSFDCFDPGERDIYKYHDGEKVVTADPMVIHKRIMEVGPELAVDMKVARSPMKDAPQAHEKMIQKLRNIFLVKSFEQGGLTERETIALFHHFMEFEDIQKKITEMSATSAGETSSPSASSSAAPLPTETSTDSGSTGNAPSTNEPPKSPTEQASPSEASTPPLPTTKP